MSKTPIKILFSEDDAFLSDVYKTKFGKAGYEVDVVLDANKIIEKVSSFKPDLLFFDILYDGHSGIEIMKQIKTNEETNHIPIIALTNLRSDEDRKKVLDAGATLYLSKPESSLEKLIAMAEEILKIQICPSCHEKTRVINGKCENCGKDLK